MMWRKVDFYAKSMWQCWDKTTDHINAQLYHSFFLLARARDMNCDVLPRCGYTKVADEIILRALCTRMRRSEGIYCIIGPSKTMRKTAFYDNCVVWRLYPFVYLVCLSRNVVNTDINCQLTFSKIHLLLITYKITFRKYTRESMHLSNISMHEKCTNLLWRREISLPSYL